MPLVLWTKEMRATYCSYCAPVKNRVERAVLSLSLVLPQSYTANGAPKLEELCCIPDQVWLLEGYPRSNLSLHLVISRPPRPVTSSFRRHIRFWSSPLSGIQCMLCIAKVFEQALIIVPTANSWSGFNLFNSPSFNLWLLLRDNSFNVQRIGACPYNISVYTIFLSASQSSVEASPNFEHQKEGRCLGNLVSEPT